jgi:hypothetical protein
LSADQRVVKAPPFTCTVWPVTCRAPGEARKKAVSLMSSARPARWLCVLGREAELVSSLSEPERGLLIELLEN